VFVYSDNIFSQTDLNTIKPTQPKVTTSQPQKDGRDFLQKLDEDYSGLYKLNESRNCPLTKQKVKSIKIEKVENAGDLSVRVQFFSSEEPNEKKILENKFYSLNDKKVLKQNLGDIKEGINSLLWRTDKGDKGSEINMERITFGQNKTSFDVHKYKKADTFWGIILGTLEDAGSTRCNFTKTANLDGSSLGPVEDKRRNLQKSTKTN
jgi:hypothetical protein